MEEKLEGFVARYEELNAMLSRPEVINDQERYHQLMREHSELAKVVQTAQALKKLGEQVAETEELLAESTDEPEMEELAQVELASLKANRDELTRSLQQLLLPKDPNEGKDVIVEIRAGTGGEEAALFAAELFRMYSRYAEANGWRTEILHTSPTEMGGFKEVIGSVSGPDAYRRLQFESGTHRVQRVPVTEAGGRIHTSAVTVAILPEAEEVEVEIDPKDLRIDVFRSSGPGGQSVNTTDSAVRITHLPTGLVASCQDEKSQHKNRAKAIRVLRARLKDRLENEQLAAIREQRKLQVGTGDRSERIRTYNFPQNRVTDHRINLTLHKLDAVLSGDLDNLIEALLQAHQEEALATLAPSGESSVTH
ncbi:MAG: peptide chain release factor 1 [Nitrospinae bacterium]|nr:peptide chain release factor 1 [Nitrospinota bacterium]